MLIVRKFAYGFVAFVAMCASTAFAAALPAGYKQCLCIYVTNENQYIDTKDTNYQPKLATDVEAHFEVPDFAQQNPRHGRAARFAAETGVEQTLDFAQPRHFDHAAAARY